MIALSMRIKFLFLVGLLFLGGVHRALAAVHMVCKGKDYYQTGPQQARTIEDSVSVTIEMDATKDNSEPLSGSIWISGYEEAFVYVTPGNNVVLILGAVQSKSGVRIGRLDRVTGELTLEAGMIAGSPKTFNGICQPGKKLF